MEITNRDKKLLVYLLAVSIIAGAYFFGARPLLDKQSELRDEITKLEMQVNHYNSVYANIGDYEAKTEEMEEQYKEMLNKFFSGLDQENTIVMLKNIEKDTNVWIGKVAFQESEVMVGAAATDTTADSETTEETDTAVSNDQVNVAITGIKQDLSIDYSASYPDFKKFIEYVKNNNQRLYISSISASYGIESDRVTGSLILSQYALDGADVEKNAPDLSDVNLGVGNIFTSGGSSSELVMDSVSIDDSNNLVENEIIESPENNTESAETEEQSNPGNSENVDNNSEPSQGPSKPQGPAGGIV